MAHHVSGLGIQPDEPGPQEPHHRSLRVPEAGRPGQDRPGDGHQPELADHRGRRRPRVGLLGNTQEPAADRELFLDKFARVFEHAGYPADQAVALAESLLPDLVAYDYSSAEGSPNGRNLTDDVINQRIALLSNGAVPHDGLRPHDDLPPRLPVPGRPALSPAGRTV